MTNVDFQILYWIQEHIRCETLDRIFPIITMFGNAGLFWILVGFLLLYFRKYRLTGAEVLTGLLLWVIVGNLILKNLVARERPCWIDDSVLMLISVPKDFSFPSGHTGASVVSALIILKRHWKIGLPALVLAVLIAFSRLYLFVHFPTDVLAGALIGTVLAFLAPLLIQRSAFLMEKINAHSS